MNHAEVVEIIAKCEAFYAISASIFRPPPLPYVAQMIEKIHFIGMQFVINA